MPNEPQRTTWSDHEPALNCLLTIYHGRLDLQSRFPEAIDWDFRRLVGWAAKVATGAEEDPASELLAPYALWYEANAVENWGTDQIPWDDWKRCWSAGAHSLDVLHNTMQDFLRTAFNQHLTTLAMLVIEFELRSVLEVGIQYGHSSLALLEALKESDGHLYSIDVEPCSEAAAKVQAVGLAPYWTFLQGNALNLHPPAFPEELDLLFIDTFHLYSQTKRELEHFAPYLKRKSWIVLHDAVTFPGVSRAVREFMESNPRKFRFYPYLHQHGLLLLRSV